MKAEAGMSLQHINKIAKLKSFADGDPPRYPITDDYSLSYYDWLNYWKNYLGFEIIRACDIMDKNFQKQSNKYYLIIRHDLDSISCDGNVLRKMIDIEESLGIYTSYYPIIDQKNYDYFEQYAELFHEIEDRGHEIGLHVNSAELCHIPTWVSRSKEEAFKRLGLDIQAMIDAGFGLKTMCYHGNRGEYLNWDLVKEYPYDNSTPQSYEKFFPNMSAVFNDSGAGIAYFEQIPLLPKQNYKILPREYYLDVRKTFSSGRQWNNVFRDNIGFVVNHPQHYVINGDKLFYKGGTFFGFVNDARRAFGVKDVALEAQVVISE